jgi:hypothetical protein
LKTLLIATHLPVPHTTYYPHNDFAISAHP